MSAYKSARQTLTVEQEMEKLYISRICNYLLLSKCSLRAQHILIALDFDGHLCRFISQILSSRNAASEDNLQRLAGGQFALSI